jgi:RNA polymerase sigma-70 factor, ECF subfamily
MLCSRSSALLAWESLCGVDSCSRPITGSASSAAIRSGRTVLDQVATLGRFLAGVEQRAYRMASIAVRNDADALDIVQDAMLQLARRYAHRPSEQWTPLFHRILQNGIRDHQRRRKVRDKVFGWFPGFAQREESDADPMENVAASDKGASDVLMESEAMRALEHALAQLPARQQQAFMLRNFEGLDVGDTARAMGCSEGSVKTHHSRAVHTLRAALGEVW